MKGLAGLLLAAAALADGYAGKYRDDPRLAPFVAELPARAARARARLADLLEVAVPAVPVVLEDAGRDPLGAVAETREGPVIVLFTEYLVLGATDVDATLLHEHLHALQRARLKDRYRALAPWAREGAAQYVAGQGPWRARVLAAHAARLRPEEPLAALVGPLTVPGPLLFERYYVAIAAFEAVEASRGRAQALALVRRLLDEPDARRAVEATVGSFEAFDAAAQARARRVLAPLVEAADSPYDRARRLHERGEHGKALEALAALRRDETTLLGEAVLLDLRCRKARGDPSFGEALARARLDLEPFPQQAELAALAGGK